MTLVSEDAAHNSLQLSSSRDLTDVSEERDLTDVREDAAHNGDRDGDDDGLSVSDVSRLD